MYEREEHRKLPVDLITDASMSLLVINSTKLSCSKVSIRADRFFE